MDSVVHNCGSLTQEDIAYLKEVEQDLGILADLSRADVLLFCPLAAERAVVVAQASPHSVLPIYDEPLVAREVTSIEEIGSLTLKFGELSAGARKNLEFALTHYRALGEG